MKYYGSYMDRQGISPESHETLLKLERSAKKKAVRWAKPLTLAVCCVLVLGLGMWKFIPGAASTAQNPVFRPVEGEVQKGTYLPERLGEPAQTDEPSTKMMPMVPYINYQSVDVSMDVAASIALMEGSFRVELTREDILPAAKSGFAVLNTLSLAVYPAFAARRCRGESRRWPFVLCCGLLLLIVELMILGCLGIFGTELTLKLNYTFFMLVRDTSIFDSLARMEALIIAVWMVTDFVLVSLLLRIASDNLRSCFGLDAHVSPESFWSLRQGRWLTVLLCAAAAAVGLCIPGDILSLGRLSEQIVPLANAVLIFGLDPLALVIGRIRGKI